MAEFLKSLAELLEVIFPVLNLVGGVSHLQADIDRTIPQVQNELVWTGEKGYLFRVLVSQRATALGYEYMYEGLRDIGPGASGAQALAFDISRDQAVKTIPNLSEDYSIYLWVEGGSNRWTYTPPIANATFRLDALAIKNDTALLEAIKTKQNNDIWLHAIGVLEKRATDDKIARIVFSSAQKISEYMEKISKIEQQLRVALEGEKKISEFLQKIQLARTATEFGRLAAQGQNDFPEAGITGSDNELVLSQKSREYKTQVGKEIIRFKEIIQINKTLTNEEAAKLRPVLKESDAPDKILKWTL
jgi:hypothetical protein